MIIERKNDAFCFRMKTNKGFEQYFLLMSDLHFDSKSCDRVLLKSHLELSRSRGAKIMMFGDIFDCMGGKYDKRTNKGDIRPEYQGANYFNLIRDDAIEFFRPYSENIVIISDGNHELSVEKMHEINLLDDLRNGLNSNIFRGKYAGFLRFFFEGETGGRRKTYTMYYNHGSGGNSPVTRGKIKTNRRQENIESDIYVSGHIHSSFNLPRPKLVLNNSCNVERVEPEHINLGCYKNDILSGGFVDMKEFQPPVLGGYWLRFYYYNKKVKYDLVRAK